MFTDKGPEEVQIITLKFIMCKNLIMVNNMIRFFIAPRSCKHDPA